MKGVRDRRLTLNLIEELEDDNNEFFGSVPDPRSALIWVNFKEKKSEETNESYMMSSVLT